MGMTRTVMRTNMRYELQDAGSALWTDAELNRAITKSVALMSRLIPKKTILETFITLDVTNETLTIASSTGTLSYKPVKKGSVKITGETEGHDKDFTVNHLTGVITEVSSNLADGDYTVSYTIDPYMLNISSLLTDYIKIERIEYPVGDEPRTYVVPEDIFGTYILFKQALTEDKHLRIHYLTYWTDPTDSVAGNYPSSLDNAIVIGSVGQALIFKAELYMQNATTENGLANAAADSMATPLSDINTALDNVATIYTDVNSALDKVATYIETNGVTDNAVDVLANITDDITNLRTAINTALAASNAYTDDVDVTDLGQATVGAEAISSLPITPTDLVNKANVGDNVGNTYANLAQTKVAIANARSQASLVYLREVEARLANLTSYIQEAGGWVSIANSFIAEAAQRLGASRAYVEEATSRIGEVNAWAVQADRYLATSQRYQDIAGRYLASGQAKINEMLVMLGLKPEYSMYKSSQEQFA